MLDITIPQLFKVQGRFLRSTHLERDWNDPAALQDYVLTTHAKQNLTRLAAGLAPQSGLRAWRITGDYGSGKSSFALLLANVLSSRRLELPMALQNGLDSAEFSATNAKTLLPVLITGNRESLGLAIVRGLRQTLLQFKEQEASVSLLGKLHIALKSGTVSDARVIKLVQAAHEYVVQNEAAQGILLVLDEAGKFLEYAAMYPDRQDVYLLQGLAELAARSGASPLLVVLLLHQGISGYAESLSQTQQREWEKIAGRYEELTWHQPVEQVAELIASALNTQLSVAPLSALSRAKQDMQEALRVRWYGNVTHHKLLINIAARLYPLHPTVLPPLVRLFSTFGQNERSLFSFLLGSEPFGMQDFVERTEGKQFFRLHDLFDYARSAFGQKLHLQSYRNHWKAIEGVVTTYRGDNQLELAVLKTIGLLNVLNVEDLLATGETLELALPDRDEVKATIQQLKSHHLLYFRGAAGGYSLWPHTSVNLENAKVEAGRALGPIAKVTGFVRDRLDVRPLVARRHYIETGTLRYYELVYADVASLPSQLTLSAASDGRILVPLCETPEEEQRALAFAQAEPVAQRPNILVAVPKPLQGLAPILDEVRRWEWIERNVPELQHDNYAREEVARQLAAAQQLLSEHLQLAVGMMNSTGEHGLRWFRKGNLIHQVQNGRDVMLLLSTVFDEVYHAAPRIQNELINRRSISSAAVSARGRLCEQLFESPTKPLLGMEAGKTPPEMSMYLSVLRSAGLHRETEVAGVWEVALPPSDQDEHQGRVVPTFERIRQVLQQTTDARVPAMAIYDALREEPFGIKEGLIPLLLAVFATMNEQELAFYEDGSFIPRITGSNFLRLTKAPETFEIQFYPINGIRTELFHTLTHALQLNPKNATQVDLLDVVKPLLTFMANLPVYTLKTSRLTPITKSVRTALQAARDPVRLLFHDLPQACGLEPVVQEEENQAQHVEAFAQALKIAVDELRGAHPGLLHYIKDKLHKEFLQSGSFETVRHVLAPRATSVAGFVTEARLKSFCLRLADTKLTEIQWLESLGNLVCAMPPAKWKDADVYKYEQEIHNLAAQFKRVEAIVFHRRKHHDIAEGESVRIALTQPNGQERGQVIHLSPGEVAQAQDLEGTIATLLRNTGRVGMAAASRALWQLLEVNETQEES
ncbi:hypothetical protein H8B13_08985 [Hymenobacter sp. BT188]|uniref:hypothetical protein n=1 Tax=Hymenobacter sp. BT188 TaxID=2763504 RepID=UPI001651755A|nr:hypothetical protein [Hymenobacter sp. BT188]MBC6606950.1 hypothetical protein [Hymenobacter sp. BT188]